MSLERLQDMRHPEAINSVDIDSLRTFCGCRGDGTCPRARLFALKSLAKSPAESFGSDPMHDSRRDSLRDSVFYAGSSIFSIFDPLY